MELALWRESEKDLGVRVGAGTTEGVGEGP